MPPEESPTQHEDAESAAVQGAQEQARHERIELIKNELGAETLEDTADSFKQIYETVQLRLAEIAQSSVGKQQKEAEAKLLLTTWRRFSNAVFSGNSEQTQSDIDLIEKSAKMAREGLQKDTEIAGAPRKTSKTIPPPPFSPPTRS